MREILKSVMKQLGLWDIWIGLRVMLQRFREETGPFPPEPWRRG